MFPKIKRLLLPLKRWADPGVWLSPTIHPCCQPSLDLQKNTHSDNHKVLISISKSLMLFHNLLQTVINNLICWEAMCSILSGSLVNSPDRVFMICLIEKVCKSGLHFRCFSWLKWTKKSHSASLRCFSTCQSKNPLTNHIAWVTIVGVAVAYAYAPIDQGNKIH